MADVISQSDRWIYLRVKCPRDLYEALARKFGGVSYGLREMRVAWESVLACVEAELLTADDSVSSTRSGGAPQPRKPDL